MKNPLVSIIIPCYNQAQYLPEALSSVLKQTYVNWECIIVNDGSPDHTDEVAKNWVLQDTRIKYLRIENGGVCNARNIGIENAQGVFIVPLDADDKISQDYIELAINEWKKDFLIKVVYCKAEMFGDKEEPLKLKQFSLSNLAKENMIFCSAIFKKEDWENIGGYDISMKNGLEDWEFWIALLKNGGKVVQIDKVGFYYRIKNGSRNKSLTPEKLEQLFEYLSVKHSDFFVKQLGSFSYLNQTILYTKRAFEAKLKSEKFVIDVFCKRFFGFTIFGKYKKDF